MKGKTKQRVMAVVLTLVMTISLLPLEFLGGGVTQVKAASTYSLTPADVKDSISSQSGSDVFITLGTYGTAFTLKGDPDKWRYYEDRIDGGKSNKCAVEYAVQENGATATLTVVVGSSGNANTSTVSLTGADGVKAETTDGKTDVEVSGGNLGAASTLVWENLDSSNSPYTLQAPSGNKIRLYSMTAVETVSVTPAGGVVAPTPLTISATPDADDASKITISGTGTAGDEGSNYVVTRTDAASKTKDMKAAGNAESFTVTDTLDASGTYIYTVKGTGKDADDKPTEELLEGTAEIVYVLPLGKAEPTAVPGDASVRVSWSAVKEATSYDVKVYQNGTELTDKSVTGVSGTSATIEGLTNGTEYGVVVVTNRSTTATDKQTTSDEVKAKPVAPEVGVTWLNANDLPAGGISTELKVNDNWTILANGSSMTVQGASVTTTDGQVFTQRISTGGSGSVGDTPKRVVQLTLTEKSYIVIYAQSSGASRPLHVAGSDGKDVTDTLALAGKDDPVDPSRAITLEPGTYYIYSTGGTGYIYGIKMGVGEAPRAAWETVEKPVINNVTRGDDGNLTVDFTANIGTDGADKAYVFMYKDGFEAGSKEVGSDADVTFTPQENGEYTFKVVICRSGEADKESDVYTLTGYDLPPAVPAITWVTNLGNGSVYVDYNNIPAACDVWYRSEGDAEYVKAAEGVTAGNYTFTGLSAGVTYDFKVTATDEKGTSTSEYKGFVVGEPVQQWYADVFGSATSGTMTINGEARSLKSPGANYTYPAAAPDVTNGNNGTIGIAASSNGKVADSEEGIQIYYTKINPNTENFKMTATFTVTDDSTFNNQSAFGIFAIDAQGVGTKDTKYFNSVSVGSFKAANVPALVCPGTGKQYYHANSARLITGYESYDTSSTAGSGRNMDNDNGFSKQPADDTTPVGATYTYTLEKTNTGFICSMEGGGDSIVFDDVHNLMVQEDGSIVVGVAAARIGVEITNIQFEKTAGGAEAVEVSNLIEPKVKVYSGTVSGTMDYEFIAGSNVDGWLDVFNFTTNEYVFQGTVQADGIVKVPVTLKSGYNDIKYAFRANENVPDLTTYAIIENTHTVAVQQWGAEGETIYTAPNASTGGAGTREEPLDLQTALDYAQPGQTIVMLDGTYYIEKDLTVQRSVNGTADKPITLTAENVGSVVVDGSKMESSSSLINLVGDYWHMYGIEFQNGIGKGISVCGNYNTVEMCKIHNVANTGLQISRFAGEPNTDDMWPSYNLIKYCEAYDCCDPGRSDADGFAAKLTSGVGNKFYGCISHHNIDDGWDLYAKSTTGSIGAVTIENCVAYSNGFLSTDDPSTMSSSDFGEGNGFKLGGENMPGAHVLKNSISYNNAGKGITSNSGPDVQVYDCTAFNNSLKGGAYNVSLYTKTSNPKAWVLDGMLSVAENGKTNAELGSSNGVINSLRSATNYLFDGSKSTNTQGVEATSDWFVSTDITLIPTITPNGIDMHGLLELKDQSLNAGAKFTSWEASAKPEATKTVATKNVISFVGFNSVALGQTGSVKTGDTTPIASLLAIMVISAGICGAYVFRRKKSF